MNRRDILLTRKLWNTHHKTEDVKHQLDIPLWNLQTDYLDLYLVRLPVAFKRTDGIERFPVDPTTDQIAVIDDPILETLKDTEALVKKVKYEALECQIPQKKRLKTY